MGWVIFCNRRLAREAGLGYAAAALGSGGPQAPAKTPPAWPGTVRRRPRGSKWPGNGRFGASRARAGRCLAVGHEWPAGQGGCTAPKWLADGDQCWIRRTAVSPSRFRAPAAFGLSPNSGPAAGRRCWCSRSCFFQAQKCRPRSSPEISRRNLPPTSAEVRTSSHPYHTQRRQCFTATPNPLKQAR